MLSRSIVSASLTVRRARLLVNVPNRACIHANICDIDPELRSDVKKLGKALGVAIKENDSKVFDIVEELRALGREVGWRICNYPSNCS